jgi:hypothetical protein
MASDFLFRGLSSIPGVHFHADLFQRTGSAVHFWNDSLVWNLRIGSLDRTSTKKPYHDETSLYEVAA